MKYPSHLHSTVSFLNRGAGTTSTGGAALLKGMSTVVHSSPVPLVFCCFQVGEVWREGGGGRRTVEQAPCVHTVPAQSFWAQDVSPDGDGAAGPGRLLSASDSWWELVTLICFLNSVVTVIVCSAISSDIYLSRWPVPESWARISLVVLAVLINIHINFSGSLSVNRLMIQDEAARFWVMSLLEDF